MNERAERVFPSVRGIKPVWDHLADEHLVPDRVPWWWRPEPFHNRLHKGKEPTGHVHRDEAIIVYKK